VLRGKCLRRVALLRKILQCHPQVRSLSLCSCCVLCRRSRSRTALLHEVRKLCLQPLLCVCSRLR
jgi:hypothetical protein